MKKYKTTFLMLIMLFSLMPLIYSCLKDNDDYYLAIATLRNTDNNKKYFILDNGKKMIPQDEIYTQLKDSQRVYVYFNILDEKKEGYEYTIKIRNMENILTKNMAPMSNETTNSIGDDPINIDRIWFGGGYLNIIFQYMGTRNPPTLHMVNLVQNETKEEEGYVTLEFRHNAHNDSPREPLDGIVSFKKIPVSNEQKGLIIRYNSIYDGIKYKKIDFEKQDRSKSFSSDQDFNFSTTNIVY